MHSHQTLYSNDPSRSKTKHRETTNTNKDILDHNEQQDNIQQLKLENTKLKKMLKDAQAKRTQITKECSQLTKSMERVETENQELRHRVQEQQEKVDGEKYRWEELKFLNKQLASEIEELRTQNETLTQKLRYSSQVLQRKYEQLQEKSYKRMDQCVKRVKKAIHYLQNLSAKQIDKTREYYCHNSSMLTDNLRKSIELLRGKYYEQLNCQGEIEELMNPLKTMQEEISVKTKEANTYRQENIRLNQEIAKYKTMEKQQIPMFKQAIEKLKKNLIQVRSQLSQNQYQKLQVKKKYEERIRETEYKYNQLFKQCRKIKLEKKIYENKLAELQADVEEEKERLIGENQMLKKLYNNQDSSQSRISQISNPPYAFSKQKKTQQKRIIKKNFSKNQLKTSNLHHSHSISDYQPQPQDISQYNQQTSMLSQQNLKQEIIKIDEEIMEIQKNLTKELQAYR